VVHEKTNPWTARKVQGALSPPVDEASYSKLCAQDEHTSWFGGSPHAPDGTMLIVDRCQSTCRAERALGFPRYG
jgi:hypothetical protein